MNEERFIEELKKEGIDLDKEFLKKLKIYKDFLKKKNEETNLTALKTDEDIYLKHFYDSVIITKYYDFSKIKSIVDVGTGAGFPGVIIKLMYPDLNVTLLDSNKKKCNFLVELMDKLDITEGIEIIRGRAEIVDKKYDAVIGRAVGSISYLAEISNKLYKKHLILLRGKNEPVSENLFKKLFLKIVDDVKYYLPITNAERRILVFKKVRTNTNYPRHTSIIKKDPL